MRSCMWKWSANPTPHQGQGGSFSCSCQRIAETVPLVWVLHLGLTPFREIPACSMVQEECLVSFFWVPSFFPPSGFKPWKDSVLGPGCSGRLVLSMDLKLCVWSELRSTRGDVHRTRYLCRWTWMMRCMCRGCVCILACVWQAGCVCRTRKLYLWPGMCLGTDKFVC